MKASTTATVDISAIYRDHLDGVLGLLRRGFQYRSASGPKYVRITSAFDLEDICQETFKEFMGQVQKGNFDTTRPPGPYLNRIAINVALRRLGKASRETLVEEIENDAHVEPEDLSLAEARGIAADFRASLDPTEAGVLERCMIEGESQAQAGEALGMSRDQVYRTLQRLKRSANRFFTDRGWFDEP